MTSIAHELIDLNAITVNKQRMNLSSRNFFTVSSDTQGFLGQQIKLVDDGLHQCEKRDLGFGR